MAPFAASNARQPSLSAGGDSSTTQLSSSPMPLAMPASNKRAAPPSMLPPLQPQSQAQQQQQAQQGGFNFGGFGSSGGGAAQQQGQGVPSASPFFGGGGGDAGLTTPAASTSGNGGGSVDYFAVPTRVAAAGGAKEAPPPTPGGMSAATPGGEPHPWAALFAQGNGPSTIGMGGGGGSITPLVGDHSAFAAAAAGAGTSDGGTTPTLRFPSALAGAGMGRSFSGGLSGHGIRNASQASSTFSAGSEGDASRFTPLDSHHLAMLLSQNNNNNASSSASSSSSTHANGIEAGTWNHPRLRRASRSSSPGGSSSSSSGGATSSSQDDASEGSTLVLDIRPSTSFGAARIRKSVNVCAPSTLLKRPGMTVQRIEEEMLGSRTDARRFARWKNGVRGGARAARQNSQGSNGAGESALDTSGGGSSAATSDEEREEAGTRVQRIVVLDTDTRRVGDAGRSNAGGGGACLIGLLRKFEAAGFEGELCWLVGGFNGFARTTDASKDIDAEKLIDRKPVRTEKDKQTGTGTGAGAGAAKAPPKADPPTHSGQIPKLSDLGKAESTRRSSAPSNLPPPDMQGLQEQQQRRDDANGAAAASGGAAGRRRDLVQPRALPAEAFTSSSLADWGPAGQSRTRGMIGSVSQPQGLDVPMSANACANPFFDNIRQNRELAHGVTERIPLDIPTLTSAQRASLPSFLARLVDAAPEARADELAQAFYDIERDEQRRLMLTMRQHASESSVDPRRSGGGAVPADDAGARGTAPQLSSRFCALGAEPRHAVPFSIAAALERGAENRYNNIWTYEHSRVKLHTPPPGACDYLNASFVEPAREHGALRRYIATQAPLPSTFEAFWTAVWEQRCACIAMLTREHESGRIQSHMYWGDGAHGKRLTLRLVHEESLDEKGDVVDAPIGGKAPGSDDGGGNLFPSMSGGDAKDGRSENEACIIVRTFELSMAETGERRTVTQLQYVAWPDYHIPDSPEALLTYMDLAAALQQAADDELRAASPNAASASSEESLVGPMVVHCSAGVGRTGTYVVIDSVLDVLRRRRAAARAEAKPKCWDNGAGISIANGVIQHRGRTKANAAQRDVRMHSPGAAPAPASSSSSSSFFSASAMGRFEGFKLDKVAVARTPRKSLKRELSPSAMDLDAPGEATSQAAGSERKDMSSPPPMRRSRSDVDSSPDDDAAGGTAGPSGRQNSLTGLTSAVTQMGKAVASSSGMQRSGSETPSKAMGGLRIAWDSTGSSSPQQPSTPTPGAAASPFAAAIAQGPQPALVLRSPKVAGSGGEDDTTMKTNEVSPRSALSPLPPSALAFESGTKHNNSSNAGGAGGENVDLIRGAVEVTREQRMSSVQTTRQYVFVYAAVLQGVLREVAREQE